MSSNALSRWPVLGDLFTYHKELLLALSATTEKVYYSSAVKIYKLFIVYAFVIDSESRKLVQSINRYEFYEVEKGLIEIVSPAFTER